MEQLILTSGSKEERYKEILPQIESIISAEEDLIANLANVAAILKEAFDFFWVGFYIVKPREGAALSCKESVVGGKEAHLWENGTPLAEINGEKELVLGPFQGPLACTRIKYGRGVCGTAWTEARTLVVPDVEQFPGHIACSSLSRSEIVVPIFGSEPCKDNSLDPSQTKKNSSANVVAVLDIDSKELATFDEIDASSLEQLARMLGSKF